LRSFAPAESVGTLKPRFARDDNFCLAENG
jgi:hypothetical protein